MIKPLEIFPIAWTKEYGKDASFTPRSVIVRMCGTRTRRRISKRENPKTVSEAYQQISSRNQMGAWSGGKPNEETKGVEEIPASETGGVPRSINKSNLRSRFGC